MNISKILFAFSLILFSHTSIANCTTHNTSFKSGEKLVYKISYKLSAVWITAGYASFSVNQTSFSGKPAYHLVGEGRTTSRFDHFFKVRDRYESFVSTQSLLPYQFIRNVEEGGVKFYNNVKFNRSQKIANTSNGKYKTKPCTHDVISALYLARNINFDQMKAGSKTYIDIFLDNKNYNVYVQYLGKETIKTPLGKIKTKKIRPQLIEGTVFDESNEMVVWVTDDKNQIPVRVKSAIAVGSVVVDLYSYENLRNTSLLK